MKKKTRILSLLLALALLGLMAACGKDAASSGGAPAQTMSAEEPSAVSATQTEPASQLEQTSQMEPDSQKETAGWPANPLGNVELPLTREPVNVTMWMGVNPNVLKITEDTGIIRLQGGILESKLEMFRCKSTNVDSYVKETALSPEIGILLRTMVSDDPFYYKTRSQGEGLYGVQITLDSLEAKGDLIRDDLERPLRISLDNAGLTGSILGGAELYLYENSRWFATGNSTVTLHTENLSGIDAPAGVQITAIPGAGVSLSGVFPLPSGGVLSVARCSSK